MFYIGQKVMCVKDDFPLILYEIALNIPRAGRVYTVCDKRICTHEITKRRELGIQLCELRNPAVGTRGEPWFSGWRFRPWEDELTNTEYQVGFVSAREQFGKAARVEVCV
jgi:hypothetical protein